MSQSELFSEDIFDALRDVVRALGGPKEVGRRLKDTMPADQAGQWVNDCLNRERRHRFEPEQVLWLLREARKVGCHSAINFLCDEAGYMRPAPLEPEDEAAALMRDYIESVKLQKRLAERLERVGIVRSVA